MEDKKSFLKVLEERDVDFNFRMLTEDGYGSRLKIPVDWFYTKGITKEDFVEALEYFMEEAVKKVGKGAGKAPQEAIKEYKEVSAKRNYGKSKISDFEVKKDESGHVYLLVTGLDNFTKVAIHQDDNFLYGKSLYRITESKFIEKLKEISDRKKVEEAIQRKGGSINLENLDMKDIYGLFKQISENDLTDSFTQAGKNIARYATYVRNMQESMTESTISCKVAEETVGAKRPRGNKLSATAERVNEIMPSKDRFDYLKSLDPEYIIKVNPLRLGEDNRKYEFQAFTYDLSRRNTDEDGTMIIIEPENGVRRTRIVYVSKEEMESIKVDLTSQGEVNVDKRRIYEQVIVDTLGKTPSEIANERKVKQTNHTTLEAFQANSKYFVSGEKEVLEDAISYTSIQRKVEERSKMLDNDREGKE